jgi:hypothetical protein
VLCLVFGLGYAVRVVAAGIPAHDGLTYSGLLEDISGALAGQHDIQVNLYDSNQVLLCQSAKESVTVDHGRFSVAMPDDGCRKAFADTPDVWAHVVVDGNDTGAAKVGAVPYAVEANHAVDSDRAQAAQSAAPGGALASQLSELRSDVDVLKAPMAWIAPTLGDGWQNYGSQWVPAGYMRDPLGFVHLRGLVRRTSGTSQVIFTLPDGYRPSSGSIHFVVLDSDALGKVQVLSDGTVQSVTPSGKEIFVSLDGISFGIR